MHRLLCLAGLWVIVLGCGTRASAADVNASLDVNSAYVWRGLTFSNGGVVQPALDVSGIKLGKASLGVNVWSNFNLSSWHGAVQSGHFSEIDLTLTALLPAGFKLGYIEYVFAVGAAPEPSTRELTASWTGEMAVTPTVSLYYDVEQIDDFFLNVSLSRRVVLSKKTTATLSAEAGCAGKKFAEYYGGAKGGLYHYNVAGRLSHQAREKVSVTGVVGYCDGLRRVALPRQDARFYFGLSVGVGL